MLTLFESPITLVLEFHLSYLTHRLPAPPRRPRVAINHRGRIVKHQLLTGEFLKGTDFLKHWPLPRCNTLNNKELDPVRLAWENNDELDYDDFDDDNYSSSSMESDYPDSNFERERELDREVNRHDASQMAEEGLSEGLPAFESPEAILISDSSIRSVVSVESSIEEGVKDNIGCRFYLESLKGSLPLANVNVEI